MSLDNINKPFNSALPRQQIPLLDKLDNKDSFGNPLWCRETMDSLEGIARYQFFSNGSLQDNYDIAEGNFNIRHYIESNDYYDFASAISQELETPNFLKHYDITGKAVRLLSGEYLKRPDLLKVKDRSVGATNERIRIKTELTQQYFNQALKKEIGQKMLSQGIDPNKTEFKNDQEKEQYQKEIEQKYQEMTPPAIQKYMKYDYRNSAEHWAVATLSVLKGKFYLREANHDEFKDFCITGRCCSHFLTTVDGFNTERWSPKNTFYDQSPEVKWWQDGNYGGRVFFDSKARVIDRYGYLMTKLQKEAMYPEYVKATGTDKSVMKEFFSASLYPFSDYRQYNNTVQSLGFEPLTGTPLGGVGGLPTLTDGMMAQYMGYKGWNFAQADLVQVTEAYWRSQRQVGQLLILNPETQQPEIHQVDETFNAKMFGVEEIDDATFDDPQPINSVIWTWHTQIWQGIKINTNYAKDQDKKDGSSLYLGIKPVDFQFKGDFHPLLRPKLPICGVDFGKMVVDLLKPYQLLYNVLFNQAYELIQRNNGKFLLMDMNFLPILKDWGGEDAIDKAMNIAKTLGFLPVDSRAGNTQGANFGQNSMIDLDDTPKVERLINLAMLIEQQAFIQIGITPQRQGQVTASETATTTTQATQGSVNVTEPYFENFFSYLKRKYQMMLDMAQFLSSQDEMITLSYTTSDLGDAFVKVTGTELMLADIGIDITYSAEDQQKLAQARMIAQQNTLQLTPDKIIDLINLDSIDDIQKSMEVWVEDQQKQKQQDQAHEKELQQMTIDAQKAAVLEVQQWQSSENQLDREAKIQEAEIKSFGSAELKTGDAGVDKIFEQSKLALESSRLEADKSAKQLELTHKILESGNKKNIEKEKLASAKEIQNKEHEIQKKEMLNKIAVENKKQKQIEIQNASQEKLAKQKHESEIALKNKDLELKNKDIELKKLDIEKAKKTTGHEVAGSKDSLNTDKTLNKLKVNEAKAISKVKVGTTKLLAKQKIKDSKKPKKTK